MHNVSFQEIVAGATDALDYCLTFFPFLEPHLSEPALQKEMEVARVRLSRFTRDTNPETVIPTLEKTVSMLRIAVPAFRDADAQHTADDFSIRADEIQESLGRARIAMVAGHS